MGSDDVTDFHFRGVQPLGQRAAMDSHRLVNPPANVVNALGHLIAARCQILRQRFGDRAHLQ